MRLDFTPVLLATVLAFVLFGVAQLVGTVPGTERGLLLFEKACPIHAAAG